MTLLQKYIWLIDTIKSAGRISYADISRKWSDDTDKSDGDPLSRATFCRWKDSIFDEFGIIIDCEKGGDYRYYIANPDDIDDNELKKWMLDSFAVGNLIGENLSLKGRILLERIPSGRSHLDTMLRAMKENRVVTITYHGFGKDHASTFDIGPYCVKLFENRWYVLASNEGYGDIRIYGLDRMEAAEITDSNFTLPPDFSPEEYFANFYGIMLNGVEEKKETDNDETNKPRTILLRAFGDHKHYLASLPLHNSQRLIKDCGDYADFELFLVPTYDFVMKLLQFGALIEVIKPAFLRKTMKGWVTEMYKLYQND